MFCLKALKISIRTFLDYQSHLNTIYKIDYILTRHFNQDCLENLFSIIRYLASKNGFLKTETFKKVFSSVLFSNFVKYKKINNKNCLDDINVFISFIPKEKMSKERKWCEDLIDKDCDLLNKTCLDFEDCIKNLDSEYVEFNIATYIAGFLLKKLQNIVCKNCCDLVSSNEENQAGFEFINAKQWPGHFLKRPNFLFSNFVSLFCKSFFASIEGILYKKNVRKIFCENFLLEIGDMFLDIYLCCKETFLEFSLKLLFRVLIYHHLKKLNAKLSSEYLKTKEFLKSK